MAKRRLTLAAIVAAATMGMGVFALPYVIQQSGWMLALIYFIALIAVISLAHIIYYRTLVAVDEKERLLGLARRYFGKGGFWAGFLAIVIGLMMGFVAYLSLGTQFLHILFPALSPGIALFLFWLFLACIIWGSGGRVAWMEGAGVTLVSAAILLIFFSSNAADAFARIPFAVPADFFLPFGALIFSLAGWTSIEQVYELTRRTELARADVKGSHMFWVFVAGTSFVGLLYWLFSLGVIASVPHVAADTVSGIASWPLWKQDALAVIGILSVAVVTIPIARELRGALEKDLRWNPLIARTAIIILPIVAVLAGLRSLIVIVSLAGGIFISAQYILIVMVGRRTVALAPREKILLDIVSIVFVCAAVYEILRFVV